MGRTDHSGALTVRVPLSVTLEAPPSNPALPVSSIEVGTSLAGAGMAIQGVSDANGQFEIESLPSGVVDFECVTVFDGGYYYGEGTLVHSGPGSATLILRGVEDVINGVAPLRVGARDAKDDLPLAGTPIPIRSAKRPRADRLLHAADFPDASSRSRGGERTGRAPEHAGARFLALGAAALPRSLQPPARFLRRLPAIALAGPLLLSSATAGKPAPAYAHFIFGARRRRWAPTSLRRSLSLPPLRSLFVVQFRTRTGLPPLPSSDRAWR